MTGVGLLPVIASMGLRHGLDPDHLAAIDGLSRFHPSRWNGFLFALGHGVLVTLLAVGFGHLLARVLEPYTVYLLLAIGVVNLWRLVHPAHDHSMHRRLPHFVQASPLMLGVIFGMGFETASQLSVLLLAGRFNPWLLGTVFCAGMMVVDGTDGVLAARTQRLARAGSFRAKRASSILGVLVVLFSFLLVAAEITKYDVDRVALPLGLVLFLALIGLRWWSATSDEPSGGLSA